MIGPKLAKTLHCFLTDREVQFEMDPNAAILQTQFNPTDYNMGMRCNCQKECFARAIKCQVYDPDGRFPFNDEEVLNLQSTVLQFRNMAQSRLATFRNWSAAELLNVVQGKDRNLRRELAFYLRFRPEEPEALWACVEQLLDPHNTLNDHAARVEAIESVAIWVAQERAVPKEKLRALLTALAAPEGPVGQREGERFTTAVASLLKDL